MTPELAIAGDASACHEGLRRFTAIVVRLLPSMLILCVVVATLEFAGSHDEVEASWMGQMLWLLHLVVHWTLGGIPLAAAFAVIEFHSGKQAPTAVAYAMAIIAGSIVGALLSSAHNALTYGADTAASLNVGWLDNISYVAWLLVCWGGLGAFLHWAHRCLAVSAHAMRGAELKRLASEQQLAAMRLTVMRAQIEPEFLLSSLRRLEALYATNQRAADRLLDALIGFLRRALVLMRQPATTVAQECWLARDFLLTAARRSGGEEAAPVIDFDGGAGAALLPAGLLLPVAQYMLSVCQDRAPADAFAIRACYSATEMRIAISAPASAGNAVVLDGDEQLAALDNRLRQLCGPDARIVVSCSTVQLTLELVIPVGRSSTSTDSDLITVPAASGI